MPRYIPHWLPPFCARHIARDGGAAGGPPESRPLRTRAGREGSHALGDYAGELFLWALYQGIIPTCPCAYTSQDTPTARFWCSRVIANPRSLSYASNAGLCTKGVIFLRGNFPTHVDKRGNSCHRVNRSRIAVFASEISACLLCKHRTVAIL